jgi:hypothetical protein
MVPEKKEKAAEETQDIEKTVDPYTGELMPVAEDADQFIEVVPEETDDRQGSNYLLNEETSLDSYVADADADAVAEQSAHYTEDEDVEADFAERQKLAVGGRDALLEELNEHHSLSPEITGGDIDASWQTANQAGEETVGGSVSTPDQDVVEELGDAAGLTYRDDEPLDYGKILDRDRNRWELNPASALDDNELPEEDLDKEDLEDEDLVELDEEDDENFEDEESEGNELEDEDLEDEDLEDDELDDEDDEEYIDAELEEDEDG